MTRFVIGPNVAQHLAWLQAVVPVRHQLFAATLIRSQFPAQLYGLVRRGELDRMAAERHLDHRCGSWLRLLGDRVLQRLAGKLADQLGWTDTFVAEYLPLTQLQANAFVCMDPALSRAGGNTVTQRPSTTCPAARSPTGSCPSRQPDPTKPRAAMLRYYCDY